MFCSNCGSRAEDGSKFCSKCGAVLNQQDPGYTQMPSDSQETYNNPALNNQPTYTGPLYNEQPMNEQPYHEATYNGQPYNQPTYNEPPYGPTTYSGEPYNPPTYNEPPYGQTTNNGQPYNQQPYSEQPYGQPSYTQQTQGQFYSYGSPTQGEKAKKPKGKNSIIAIISIAAIVVLGIIACFLLLKNGGSTGTVSGKITNAETYIGGNESGGLENVLVVVRKENNKIVAKQKTNAEGEYSFKLKEGSYTLSAEYDGFISTLSSFNVTEDNVTNMPLTKLVTASELPGTVSGTVINSLTGEPVNGAAVNIHSSSEGSQFTPVSLTTDDTGRYTAEVPAGYYDADISVVGFTNLTVPLIVIGGQTVANQNGAMTPILEAGQLRIVLTWGEFPQDLDSHLTGPSPEGKAFHIFYNHQTSDYTSETMAGLDLDETTSYGPETTTIYKAVEGTYSFYVHDYSNRDCDSSAALANSGAVVQVYAGDSMIGQYNVPSSLVGSTWHVFDFTGGQISTTGIATFDIQELSSDTYDSGWVRIEGDKIPVGVSVSVTDISNMGFTKDTTLLDLVDKFGLPTNYDSIDTLKADMAKGSLYREDEEYSPTVAYWDNGMGITYGRFEPGTWKAKTIGLDVNAITLPYNLKSGMTMDEVISAMQIGPKLSEIVKLASSDEIIQYCQSNKISGKDFKDGYVQVFLTNGSFGYEKYTYDADGFDELDYYLFFNTEESVLTLSFVDDALTSASLSLSKPSES